MPKRIYLVRHGETYYNEKNLIQGRQIDAELNKTGKQQAADLVPWFQDVPVGQVYCSSLVRTQQTAKPILELKNIPYSYHPELDELDYGDFEGQSIREDNQPYHDLRNSWIQGDISRQAPNGESPLDVLHRADPASKKLIRDSQNDHILFMIHGRLLRILLSHWLGYGLERMQEIKHANTAINILEFQNDAFTPVRLHITDHLKNATTY